MKTCSKCKTLTASYYTDKRASDGLQSQCKACMRSNHAANYESKKGRMLADMRQYYAQNKETVAARMRAYYALNREAVKARVKAYKDRTQAVAR